MLLLDVLTIENLMLVVDIASEFYLVVAVAQKAFRYIRLNWKCQFIRSLSVGRSAPAVVW